MLISTKKFHAWILFLFLAIALFLTLGKVGTEFRSFALLTPDLGVYASLAAAQESPDLFVRDPFLSNEKNINSYNMVYVPVIKALQDVFGNYGTACAFLLPFFIFIHLTGYYVLGVSIFRNPWAGLLVSLLLSTPVFTFYDYWGLILDALPRFLYQGMIPFVLALSIMRGSELKWWPVILGSIALLNYIHPLSTPAWAAAVILALWISAPQAALGEKARALGLAIFVFLLILFPFVINYVKSTIVETSSSVSYEEIMAILRVRFGTMAGSNPLTILAAFFRGRPGIQRDYIWYLVWLLGGAGIMFGLIERRNSDGHAALRQIAAWLAGIFMTGGCLPVLEQMVFTYLKRIPPEFELLRTLRYLLPVILLAAFYALWLINTHVRKKNIIPDRLARYIFVGMSFLLLVVWGVSNMLQQPEFRSAVKQNGMCWLHGKLVCPLPASSTDFIALMDVLRTQTPPGARILSEGEEVAIRYYGLRPLVFTYKDGAPLAYTDQEELLLWYQHSEAMDEIAFIRKFAFRRKAFVREMVEFARATQAEYLILREPHRADLYYPEGLQLVYTNTHYSLYKLAP